MSRFQSHLIPWGSVCFLDSLTIIHLCVLKWFSFQFHLNTHPPNMTFSFLWAVALWQPKGILFPQNKSHLSMNNEHNHFWFDWIEIGFPSCTLSHMNQSQCTDMNDWDFSLSLTQLWDLKIHMPFEMIEWMHTIQWISLLPGVNWVCGFDSNTWILWTNSLKDWNDFYWKKNTLSKMSLHKKRKWLVHLCKGKKVILILI